MRARRPSPEEVAETARRRLALLTAELAQLREESAAAAPGSRAVVLVPDEHPATALLRARGRHARRPVGVAGRVGSWAHDRLPPTLQGRLGLTPGNVSVVMLLVALGFAVTAWWVLRADSGTPVEPRAEWAEMSEMSEPAAVASPVAGAVQQAALPEDAGVVVVDVTGKVRRRGIVTLPLGSRVVDALEAAGGPRRGVDLTTLNLARVLADGEQIVVGVPPPGGVAAPAASAAPGGTPSPPLINLNTASQVDLEALPGVGPVTAASIVTWRTENGPFTSVEELLEVPGIGDARLADIAPFVTL